MNCGTCKHWDLSDPRYAPYGYGKCDARKHEADRLAIATSAQCVCRIGKFAKADIRVIVEREKAQQVVL